MSKIENAPENKEAPKEEADSLVDIIEQMKKEAPAELEKIFGDVDRKFAERMEGSKDKPESPKKFLILECTEMKEVLGKLTILADERLDSSNVEMIDVVANTSALPENLDGISGILISGSASDIVEKGEKAWIGQTEAFVKKALDAGIPVLGVCFGIQLHADLMGRDVPKNQGGREMGIWKTAVYMENENPNPIFDGIPFQESEDGKARSALVETVGSHAYHADISRDTAREKMYGYHYTDTGHGYPMIETEGSFIGFQFHPELGTPEGLAFLEGLVKKRADKLVADGRDPQAILQEIDAYKKRIAEEGGVPINVKLLQNFVSMTLKE